MRRYFVQLSTSNCQGWNHVYFITNTNKICTFWFTWQLFQIILVVKYLLGCWQPSTTGSPWMRTVVDDFANWLFTVNYLVINYTLTGIRINRCFAYKNRWQGNSAHCYTCTADSPTADSLLRIWGYVLLECESGSWFIYSAERQLLQECWHWMSYATRVQVDARAGACACARTVCLTLVNVGFTSSLSLCG